MISVSAQCTNHSDVELLVDGIVWNSTILYQLSNEDLVVGCRKCNTEEGPPKWLDLNLTEIQHCDNASDLLLCSQTHGSIELLKFSPFKELHAGEYHCDSKIIISIKLGELLCMDS